MYKLLIVEDETIIRKGLVQAIDWEEMGFCVIADVSDGKKALQCMDEAVPDVLLTDIRMPIMGGLELMSIVSERFPKVQLVVLSGYGDFSYAQHAIRCGVVSYILKPTRDEEIAAAFKKVKYLLDKRSEPIYSAPPALKEKVDDPVIQRAKEYLDQNFSEKVTLETVAAVAYMNPSYFSTFFKQKTGTSFKDYLTNLRMKKAKELVLDTAYKAYHIAVMVGYDDHRYFGKLFRETYGMSVSEMRKGREK